MKQIFKHIKDDKKTRDSDNTLITAVYILTLSALTLLLFHESTINMIFYLIVFVAIIYSSRFLRFLYKDWAYKNDIIGLVTFDSDWIQIENVNQRISIANISKLTLQFNYIKGKRFNHRDIIHNGLATLKIDLKDNESKKFTFLIETKEQLENLSQILKDFYKAGIKIEEYFCRNSVKTFLLKTDWNYAEIQKLKTELNIEK